MKLDIITPDVRIFEGDVKSVRVPGKKGSFQVLKDHAPIISTLESGKVYVVEEDGTQRIFEITSGVIEVRANKIILLADSAI